MYGLCMTMLVPQKGFLCPTVSTIASGKPSQMLMGSTQAMKRKRVRTNFSKQNSHSAVNYTVGNISKNIPRQYLYGTSDFNFLNHKKLKIK